MVKLNKIYTRTGDEGQTGLGDGTRVAKFDARVTAYGEVDELNSALGLARLHATGRIAEVLARVQNDLFDLGADLCVPASEEPALRMTPAQADSLERAIDELNAELKPLTSFILPGGAPAAAALHLARTICRRAERAMVYLATRERVGAPALIYINRLSDYLFVAARYANDKGAGDILWVPGANREAI